MKLNRFTVFGIIFITFWTGIAFADIGQIRECEVSTWTLPITIFVTFLIPFLAGYFGGQMTNEESN